MQKEEFFEKYAITQEFLDEHNIRWEKLEEIYDDFIESKEKLKIYANLIAELLRNQEKVHTVRSRIKDPEHLIEKLIRKTPSRKEKYGSDFEFTIENYKKEITDLIGVRVIHIFKEDWQNIHDSIKSNWNVTESQANIREGDGKEQYTDLGVDINSRETGYRSVHYLIEFTPTNELIKAEIQVRTIFEEGYGEIDHQLSYPSSNVPEVLLLNLRMLNRLAGSADEMASAVKILKDEWKHMELSLNEKDTEVDSLKAIIERLDIQQEQKMELVEGIGKLNSITSFNNLNIKNSFFRDDDDIKVGILKNSDLDFSGKLTGINITDSLLNRDFNVTSTFNRDTPLITGNYNISDILDRNNHTFIPNITGIRNSAEESDLYDKEVEKSPQSINKEVDNNTNE